MHSIIKSSFYVVFLIAMILMGSIMFFNSRERKFNKLFGLMALLLGVGESFYLIPRIISLFSDNLETNKVLLDVGKIISSITIVLVFILLYKLWKLRYNITGYKWLDLTAIILTITSIVLNLLLQDSSSILYIIRIFPFVFIGIILIRVFYKESQKKQDPLFKFMWLAVLLSFVFYLLIDYIFIFLSVSILSLLFLS